MTKAWVSSMLVSSSLDVNEQGRLTIGGCDAAALREQFGTPLYVMDENAIRRHCRAFRESIEKYYGGNGRCIYASKTFLCLAMARIVQEEGLGMDVVSGGEIATALKAGVNPKLLYFHGNNKTSEELVFALEHGVGRIVVDNPDELQRLCPLARSMGKTVDVLLRVKPGIDAHTHSFIRTGQIDSKFGFALELGEAMQAVKTVLEEDCLRLRGVHCHIGSQIFEMEPFEHAAQVMLQFMAQVRDETGVVMEELNLGGGFGIRYLPDDDAKPYEEFMQRVSSAIRATCADIGLPVPFVTIEPGRSIAGPAGTTLYTVGGVKEIPGVRNYVSVDGGMADNPRYALYQADYTVLVANRMNEPADYKATIAGKCCESGDLLQENVMIAKPQPGDLLAVCCTGAYNYSMSSNYNRIPRPAVVMIRDGKPRVIVKRETYDDLMRNDLD